MKLREKRRKRAAPREYGSTERRREKLRIEAGVRFICDLAAALHRYGTSADKLEETLEACARRLDLSAQFFASPTSILVSVESRRGAISRMIRVEESELHLEKLLLVDQVIRDIGRGHLGVDEARSRLAAIEAAPDRFGPVARVFGFAIAATLVSVLFGGSQEELTLTGATALAAGSLCAVFSALERLRPLTIPVAAAFASATAFHVLGDRDPTGASIVTVSSLILLMPGMKVTVAMRELAHSHLTAGTTRMVAALRTLLGLAFGVILGRHIAERLPSPSLVLADGELPGWALLTAVSAFPLALLVDFRARARDLPVIAIGCLVAYFAARWGREHAGPELGAFTGSLAVGLASNLFARLFDRPSSLMQIPGVTLLVPGSIGFRSVVALLEHDAVSGIDTGFSMVMVGTALGSGLIVANVLAPPRRPL